MYIRLLVWRMIASTSGFSSSSTTFVPSTRNKWLHNIWRCTGGRCHPHRCICICIHVPGESSFSFRHNIFASHLPMDRDES
ncbi:uncharacterized protein EI90DRAFT_3030269 [Cantharellus anzutake]|uniref:uncharacterized protein n=1 Tax=Cantharellus anzutake TaxID=1750568 RepID=UPI001904977D|nr:uncharacterized protein EI90DRAFT_3030269 [Cantharellus anzutake]KAF8342793.1 hypothetical protein EI90DRAFT_3030269 [Cantharellus anzutake]